MPIYEYKCENGHVFEALQKMADDPLTRCEQCGAPVQRVFHPIAVHFKGSGFYTTDYGSGSKTAAGSNNDSGSSSDSSGDKSDSGSSEKSSDSKSDSKKSDSTTKSSSSSSSDS
jgi:putative FmdB family regulatory protein